MTTQTKTVDTTKPLDQLPADRFSRPQRTTCPDDSIQTDLKAMMTQAVQNPLNYPSLDQSVFPGDTVAIALQHNLPRPVEVLDALLSILATMNIEPVDVTVVIPGALADAFAIQLPTTTEDVNAEEVAPSISKLQLEFNSVNYQIHQPANDVGLSYLIANEAGDPIHLNRLLVDADVVLPVGCPDVSGPGGVADAVYPTFGAAATLERFQAAQGSLADRVGEVQLINDSLGSFFSIQLVTGPGDAIKGIVAGVRDEAVRWAAADTAKLWALPIEKTGDAIVATIESRPSDQNWDDFADALIHASELTSDTAPIVVWSEIGSKPGRNIRKAFQSRFEETISHKLSNRMQRVAAIMAEHPVFLRSRLPRSVIEDYGLAVIETVEEIVRLTDACNAGILIRDAHKVQIKLSGDAT